MSKELAVKHPLQNKWAWWFYKNEKGKTWEANLRLITTFDTVSFDDVLTFGVHLNVCGHILYLFKKGFA